MLVFRGQEMLKFLNIWLKRTLWNWHLQILHKKKEKVQEWNVIYLRQSYKTVLQVKRQGIESLLFKLDVKWTFTYFSSIKQTLSFIYEGIKHKWLHVFIINIHKTDGDQKPIERGKKSVPKIYINLLSVCNIYSKRWYKKN